MIRTMRATRNCSPRSATRGKRQEGFTLLEFVIAAGLVATMLLSLAHLQRAQRVEHRISTVALEMSGIKEVVHHYLMQNPIPPEGLNLAMLLDQGLYLGPLLNPWERPYIFTPDTFGLQLSTEIPQAHRAQQLANRLSNSRVDGERVFTRIPVPLQEQDTRNALHRVAVPG